MLRNTFNYSAYGLWNFETRSYLTMEKVSLNAPEERLKHKISTGKSFLIQAIKALVTMWLLDGLTCAIAAPTGLAAFNVDGVAIHRLFQLPIEHEGKAAGYWSLPKASEKVMKTTLRQVKMIIIDEIFMVSSLTLAYMHLRQWELFGGGELFGSRNMLFVGDLLQLQPISGNPVL